MKRGDLVIVVSPTAVHSGAVGLVSSVLLLGNSVTDSIKVQFARGNTGLYLPRDLRVVGAGATKAQKLALKQLSGLV